MVVKQADQPNTGSQESLNGALTRGFDGGSKQTRTADPLLVRQRQYVRQHPHLYVPASQSGIQSCAHPGERPRTTVRGYTPGYISRPSRPQKGDTPKIN
jgi:hypothetical protein